MQKITQLKEILILNDFMLEQKIFNNCFKENQEIVRRLNKLNIYTMSELTEILNSISKADIEIILAAAKKYESITNCLVDATNKLIELFPQEKHSNMIENMVDSLSQLQERVETTIKPIIQVSNSLIDIMKEPLERFTKLVTGLFKSLPLDEKVTKLFDSYNSIMLNQKWIPLLLEEISLEFITKIANSKKEVDDIDDIVYSYFDNSYIKSLELKVERRLSG